LTYESIKNLLLKAAFIFDSKKVSIQTHQTILFLIIFHTSINGLCNWYAISSIPKLILDRTTFILYWTHIIILLTFLTTSIWIHYKTKWINWYNSTFSWLIYILNIILTTFITKISITTFFTTLIIIFPLKTILYWLFNLNSWTLSIPKFS